jgi:hypothetical protein
VPLRSPSILLCGLLLGLLDCLVNASDQVKEVLTAQSVYRPGITMASAGKLE